MQHGSMAAYVSYLLNDFSWCFGVLTACCLSEIGRLVSASVPHNELPARGCQVLGHALMCVVNAYSASRG
jgi:hypothetical protein